MLLVKNVSPSFMLTKIAPSPIFAEVIKLVCNNTHVPQSDIGKGSPLFYMGLTIALFINPFRKLIVIIKTSNRTKQIKTKGRRHKILTWKNPFNKKAKKIIDANQRKFTIKGSDNWRVKQFCLIYSVSPSFHGLRQFPFPHASSCLLPFSLHLALHPFPLSHVLDVKKKMLCLLNHQSPHLIRPLHENEIALDPSISGSGDGFTRGNGSSP
jgi:hypothetical protein